MEKIEAIIRFLFQNPNFGTFVVALLTFGITFANFYRNRASIKVNQLPESQSVLIKPDFIDQRTPDRYWHSDYRLIMDIIITNKSAKPISITEFTLNNKMKFNSYHKPGDFYQVTLTPAETMDDNGILFGYGSSKYLGFPINDSWLQPIIDIPPHTSVRGHLFFHFPNKDMVSKENNRLDISTSRKTFTTYLDLYDIHESRISPPENILKARHDN